MSKPVMPGEVKQGLSYSYFEGTLRILMDFQKIISVKTWIAIVVTIEPKKSYSFIAKGYDQHEDEIYIDLIA